MFAEFCEDSVHDTLCWAMCGALSVSEAVGNDVTVCADVAAHFRPVSIPCMRTLAPTGIHALATQMGTSIGMIERHYSHLTPRRKKDMLSGERHDLPADQFLQRYKS